MKWEAHKIKKQIEISEIFTLFEYHFDCGYSFPGEIHDFWECLYVIDGFACALGDERVYNLEAGEIIFHKPLEFHSLNVDSDNGAEILFITFSAAGELTDFIKEKVFKLSLSQKEIMSEFIKYLRKNKIDSGVKRKEDLYLPPLKSNPLYSQWVSLFMERIILSLADDGNVSDVSKAADAMIFNRAVGYMNSMLCRQITVEDVARFCNVSIAGLKRIFSKYAGMGIHKYYLKLKIKLALELLENGNSVSDVAQTLGFSSQAYFSKAFKRETGMNASAVIATKSI